MRIHLWAFCCCLLFTGCGEHPHEKLTKETVAVLDEMAMAVERSGTAAEAKPKLEAALEKMKDLKKREDALGPPRKAVGDSLRQKYDAEIARVNQRLQEGIKQLGKKDAVGIVTLLPVFAEMSKLDKK